MVINSSSHGTYFIDEYQWTVNGETTEYSFDKGEYTVQLTVVGTEGYSDSTTQEIKVEPSEEEDPEESDEDDSTGEDPGEETSDEDGSDSQDDNKADDGTDGDENLLTWIFDILLFR